VGETVAATFRLGKGAATGALVAEDEAEAVTAVPLNLASSAASNFCVLSSRSHSFDKIVAKFSCEVDDMIRFVSFLEV
jgi:hypothetical protein